MATRTYTTQLKGHGAGTEIHLKLKKDHASNTARRIDEALTLGNLQNWREITGVTGESEYTSTLHSLFGPGPVECLADPEGYRAACAAFLATIPDPITADNLAEVLTAAGKLTDDYIPVIDKRRSPEQQAEQNQEYIDREAEQRAIREAEQAERAALYAESTEPITTPDGKIPVVIQLHYDDSDLMSDYYHPNASHGESYLVGYVKEGSARTERSHRAIIAKFPELAALTWTWHAKEYSGGHGTWLQSEAVTEITGRVTYGGRSDPPAWWEVSFSRSSYGPRDLLPFNGYTKSLKNPAPSTPAPIEETPNDSDVIIPAPEEIAAPLYIVKYERDWTWIHFTAGKPSDDVLNCIRPHGRYGRRRSAWYITRHVEESEIAAWFAPVTAPDTRDWLNLIAAPIEETPSGSDVIIPADDDIILSPAPQISLLV